MTNFKETLAIFTQKALTNGRNFGARIPSHRMDINGKHIFIKGGGWTDSFWVGVLNIAYSLTKKDEYLEISEKYQDFFRLRVQNTDEINKREKFLPLDHDIGFIFSLSQVARYKLIGDEESKDMALKAADILAGRFNEKGKFIRAWDAFPWDKDPLEIEEKKGKFIIDCMMNLPLLFWASEQTGDEKYKNVAMSHIATVMKYMVRKDYSTYHTFNMNHITGEPIGGKTGQGYSDESCWSRGQAWGLYGFSLAYKYTKNEEYLNVAKNIAEYFYSNLGDIKVPVWDFSCKEKVFCPIDSSAAAIASCGLLEIAKHTEGTKYYDMALSIMDDLTKLCSTFDMPKFEPFLLHGCVGSVYREENENVIFNPFIDTPLIYGDYFYYEALARINDPDFDIFW